MKITSALFLAFFALFGLSLADTEVADPVVSKESDEISDKDVESFIHFIKDLVNQGYEENKLDFIADIVGAYKEDPDLDNITLVGWQNIYGEDGTVKEIRTIELFIPKSQDKPIIKFKSAEDDEDSFDPEDYDKLNEAREAIHGLHALGLDMELFYEEQNKYGEVEEKVYFNSDSLVLYYGGIIYANYTIYVENTLEVEEFLKGLKKGNLPSSILNFDRDGQFVKEGSVIVPELLSSINGEDRAPTNVMEKALYGLTEVSLEAKSRDEVPEKLQAYMSEAYPETTFLVTAGEPDADFIVKSYQISLLYDLVELQDSLPYTIFGYVPKKN